MKKFLAFVVLALAIVVIIVISDKKDDVDTDENLSTQMPASLVEEENAVILADQKPGMAATVSYAKLAQPGFIIIYKTDTETNTKKVVGTSALLPAGENFNVEVTLTEETTSGDSISAELTADDGDGEYSEETDTPVLDGEEAVSSDGEISEDAPAIEEIVVSDLVEEEGYTLVEETVVEEEVMTDDESSDEEVMTEGETEEGEVMTDETTDEESTNQ
ncbi:hypothetical protein KC842_02385 [Candidatus Nomurabacteria bacterium]|nr:hypothetical protein [Candidatus Nomurabacteria bacterium]USN95110.1 MAG: hypothetical protein H6791_01640 [Candidatus Nomurabacteria bacterium]